MQGKSFWNGTIWGTNRGPALVELDRQGETLSGRLLLIEPGLGTTRARITGTWTDKGGIAGRLDQFTTEFSVATQLPKDGAIKGVLDPSGLVIDGEWNTDAGTGGKFVMVYGPKIDPALPAQVPAKVELQAPEAKPVLLGPLITTTLTLGTVRLDRDDLAGLVDAVNNGMAVENPAINASHRGREYIHLGMQSLNSDLSLPAVV